MEYFTLVFKGSIRDFKEPLKTETPFGIPVAAGVGDAFAETEELHDSRDAIEQRNEALEAALRFYADTNQYAGQVISDCGQIARAALAPACLAEAQRRQEQDK